MITNAHTAQPHQPSFGSSRARKPASPAGAPLRIAPVWTEQERILLSVIGRPRV